MQGHTHRTHRPHHPAPLFERKADGTVHDENAHGEGQKAEGGEVQMKTISKLSHIGVVLNCDDRQVWRNSLQLRASKRCLRRQDQTVDLALLVQQVLRNAHVGDDCVGRRLWREDQLGIRRCRDGIQCVLCPIDLPYAGKEAACIRATVEWHRPQPSWCCHRIEPDQSDAIDPPFDHGADQPT